MLVYADMYKRACEKPIWHCSGSLLQQMVSGERKAVSQKVLQKLAEFVQEKQLEVLGEVWISSLCSMLCFSLPAPKPYGLWL